MKEFLKSTLKVIALGILNYGVESDKFTIKCPKCERHVVLEDGFLNSYEDIEVTVDENYIDNADEKYIISIKCRCGSKISSDF
ncbi:hypothetical protein V3595_22160 [Bacillus sp. CFBP9009]